MADIREAVGSSTAAVVPLVTTAETTIILSDPLVPSADSQRIFVIAWAQLTTGTATTTVTPRIYRVNAGNSTLLSTVQAENVKAAAGGTEPFVMMVLDTVSNLSEVRYSYSLQQAAATGNGSVAAAAASILVLAL